VNSRTDSFRIVVGGFIGLLPAGGVTWDYIQYPLGLAAMGHDVFYVEDTRLWPVYQEQPSITGNISYLAAVMEAFGLGDRWAYRDEMTSLCYGMTERRVQEVCRSADVFLNISCSTFLRDEYRSIPVRILLDSDPMFTQVQALSKSGFTPGDPGMRELLDGHTHHFTFGQNIGGPDCRVPDCGIRWLPTLQPISLEHWPERPLTSGVAASFTTVMNWAGSRGFVYGGETWGQKAEEFLRIMDLPSRVPELSLVQVVGQTGGTGTAAFPAGLVRSHGWTVLNAAEVVADVGAYRRFIQESSGEFSVAKEAYVKARTGWFSCRSACYLATGRPVVTQETGWSRSLPSGTGLLAFDDMEGAADALRRVSADPAAHARAARDIAEEYFRDVRVLGRMLESAGV
jgi:hypothetical protein